MGLLYDRHYCYKNKTLSLSQRVHGFFPTERQNEALTSKGYMERQGCKGTHERHLILSWRSGKNFHKEVQRNGSNMGS